jgi:hypothetical protein
VGGIRGRTPGECFGQFTDYLNPLLQATLSKKAQVRVVAVEGKLTALLELTEEFIKLGTKFGALYFSLAQSLECDHDPKESAGRQFRLSTREYWYRLQRTPDPAGEALIRWEYMSPRHKKYGDHRWCWRHVQLKAGVDLDGGRLNFNKVHTPSGYVVIEDVIRFLVHDLNVKSPQADWHERLNASEKLFKENFNRW